jgi:hypothetical protein
VGERDRSPFSAHILALYGDAEEGNKLRRPEQLPFYVRFEVFTAVAMKNDVFWDVTPCGSCKNRRFGGT